MKRVASLLPVVMVIIIAGTPSCASISSFFANGGEGGEVAYAADADENMKRGMDALGSKNYTDAARYFEYVRTKFPFMEISKTAELKLADTDFEREHYTEARERYQNFIRIHPTHPRIDYAAYRSALTHYRDMPSDLFFLPPSSEKDQTEVRSAMLAVSEFMRNYPKSEFVPDAQKLRDDVVKRLAEHELYVADFYAAREAWRAVIGRLSNVTDNYTGVGFDERAYFGIYDAYRSLNDDEKARAALERYVARFPDDRGAVRARRILSSAKSAGVTPKRSSGNTDSTAGSPEDAGTGVE